MKQSAQGKVRWEPAFRELVPKDERVDSRALRHKKTLEMTEQDISIYNALSKTPKNVVSYK